VAWFDFEQGLGSPERAWFAASLITRQERGAGAKRSPDTPGQDERPCEKQTKTGPTKLTQAKKYRQLHYDELNCG